MTDTADLTTQLAALQAQLAAIAPPSAAHAAPWGQTATAAPQIQGVAVPIKVQTPAGSLRIYLSLGPAAMASPAALQQAIDGLAALGLPLDTWGGSSGGSSWGGSGSRGWDGSRGGYRR